MKPRISGRKIVKTALLVSIVLVAVPILAGSFTKPAHAQINRGFHFMSLAGIPAGSTPASASEIIVMDGNGVFQVSQGQGNVQGGGTFNHVNNAASGLPKPLLGFGTWKAVSVVNYVEAGTYGAQAAGTLVVNIELFGASGAEIPATLTVNCHIPFVPLGSGPEGITIDIGSTTFSPVAGLTVFDVLQQNS